MVDITEPLALHEIQQISEYEIQNVPYEIMRGHRLCLRLQDTGSCAEQTEAVNTRKHAVNRFLTSEPSTEYALPRQNVGLKIQKRQTDTTVMTARLTTLAHPPSSETSLDTPHYSVSIAYR